MKTLPLLLSAFAVFGALGLNAEPAEPVDRTQPPAAGALPEVKFPEAVTETLPNGLKVFVLPTHKEPMVTYRLLFKSGDSADGGKPGLSDLTAALLNKGTEQLDATEFAKKTDFLGISVEGASGPDSITVTARGLSRDSGAILGFLRDAALHPAFRTEEVHKEKTKMTAELEQKKMEPGDLAARLRDKLIYGNHPYGQTATPESVQSITREEIAAFHADHYRLNNATLAIVGDVDPKAVLAQVKKAFGSEVQPAPAKARPGVIPGFPKIRGVSVYVVDRPGSVQSNIIVAGRGVPRDNPDLPELGVVNTILGGGMSGRLFANLREKHGYTYGSYSAFGPRKFAGAFSATAQVRNAVTGAAVGEILNELKRITTDPIPAAEFNLQRNFLVGNFLMSVENDQRTAERQQEIDLYGLPADYYKTYAARLEKLTPEKAEELAKRYLSPENVVIVVVGEAKEIVPQLEQYGKVTVFDTDLKEKK